MNVLLSVRPRYAKEIITGRKKYEFRKTIFKNEETRKVLIYATSTIKKIIGCFEVGEIIEGSPHAVWKRCKEYAGISWEEYYSYFAQSQTAYAIEIVKFLTFEPYIDPYQILAGFAPPQSFYYLQDNDILDLMKRVEGVRS
ncbi:MAG: ASCH domain-containing protein [Actinobacteria bacterium]|nr:ASCH domain-containing protein [Actinomycetota bacterium]MCG2818046.1 ASCH domain-containing protein [Actinomycetes bacterium]MBU4217358.1 ASCH domain-containing protein [Actinomycetota bacterium]MBU4359634.1 ASCH domain-containing protein [Actinomycetota bacterium]MBU4392197.1 ASCH domain-containing protein [Actinomycetota bacterium]